ncbi:YodC family protein [Hydrogenophaga sp. NFH-34]|uniref:YodC family protein n=1 Tax=Hydrogenophaga sp. NFH-34 TaxID=2744446 RepID=UPI001F24764B|nr:DUF2158 domain-containing protein [Hydrogenophaga sp. NFH-34]
MKFQIGDVVRLNSGGPDMTVSGLHEKKFPHGGVVPVVACTWFDGKTLSKESFKPELLTKVEKQA